ncbi:MAG: NAD(P)(+) transhydrogenase (Re/Si-specific) subunit beta, partial [Candidatus Pacebacteria bacterium]|nr:NAD(P)(+) transhydrogenase (Re/Si-specific) subunit beta [Candidatus Paceibacterota bacterium]
MSANLTTLAYSLATILFILALRGLSSPMTARRGNLFGMIGMVVAIATTLAQPNVLSFGLILAGIALGGAIGTVVALKIKMTALPQLVAAFHSLVGLAAVCVAVAAFNNPGAYHILNELGAIKTQSRIEMGLGVAIGAITFTGSVVAFGKLQGLITGKPLVFAGQHVINLLIGIAIIGGMVWFTITPDPMVFAVIVILSLLIGFMLILPIGGADMPVVISMLNSYSGWAA